MSGSLKYKLHPLLASLPEWLKDPQNCDRVQRVILESLASKHSHGEIVEWASCVQCQKRFAERGFVLKKLGFSSPQQYMAWKKVHEQIKKRVSFPKHNTL